MFSLDTFAKKVAAYLPGWKATKTTSWHHLEGPDGARLKLHYNEKFSNIEIIPCYINQQGKQYPFKYLVGDPFVKSIKIGISRNPESAAKDIKRRILDSYLPLFEKVRSAPLDVETYENAKAKVASELAKLLNDSDYKEGSDIVNRFVYRPESKEKCYVVIRAGDKCVDLRISDCPIDVAKQILALFPKLDPGQRI